MSRTWRVEQDSEARTSLNRWKREEGPSGRGKSQRKAVELGLSRGMIPETQVLLAPGTFHTAVVRVATGPC